MRKFLNSKYKLFYAIVTLSLIVLGLSYASFVLVSKNYKASEMLISNLMYGIEITSLGGEETINGSTVTLSSGKTTAVLVKIKSLNPINSKYGIDFKITGGTGNVYYANTTTNLPEETIEDYDSSNTKVIKVIIEATTDITVDFKISGGYTGNTNIDTYTGYTRITNEYTDSFTITLNAINGTITSTNPQSTTFNGSLTFNITPNDGYKLEDSEISCTGSAIGTIITTGVEISNVKGSQICTILLKQNLPTLYEKILADNPTVNTRTDFSVTNVANTTGTIYSTTATEDGSTVYYYSGNTTNNWIYFGGFYWRIIRTNEDGSVRVLYSGTSPDTTEGYIEKSKFNTGRNAMKYVGYMYGSWTESLSDDRTNTNDSTIKQTIDTWYENNLLTNYDKYISKTAIYCNDRSIGSGTYIYSESFYYGAYTRLRTNKTPTYKCGGNTSGGLFESTQAVEDKFSASTSGGGNGKLKYPIALMTVDEVAYAGGVYNTNLSSPYAWYYTNSTGSSITGTNQWWTLSPGFWGASYSTEWNVFGSNYSGRLNTGRYVDYSDAVRPSISLKSCTKWSSGDGTSSNPYTVSVDDTCANAEN